MSKNSISDPECELWMDFEFRPAQDDVVYISMIYVIRIFSSEHESKLPMMRNINNIID